MPFNVDAEIYPDDDSWVGTGRCFFDTHEAASRFYHDILPSVVGYGGGYLRPFHSGDWEYVGAVHERPPLTLPAEL